jgi:RNA polymerase sigma-70 factor (ECF subfamily)
VTKPDEQRLLRDLRAGRPEACAELIRTHYRAVYRLLAHLTRDVQLAEDLTQETFTAAWEKLATFQGRSTLATWLHRIAYTKFIDARRAGKRAAGILEQRPNPQVEPTDPGAAVMADDEAQQLYRALDCLDTPARTLLVLHYLQGMSYSEIAAVLDEPTGTLKWRTREAVNRLRALLSDEVPDHATGKTSEPGSIP